MRSTPGYHIPGFQPELGDRNILDMFALRKKSEMRASRYCSLRIVTIQAAGRISVSLTLDGERDTGKDAYAT